MDTPSIAQQVVTIVQELAAEGSTFGVSNVIERLPEPATRQYVTRILRKMTQDGTIVRTGSTRDVRYQSPDPALQSPIFKQTFSLKGLRDYIALEELYHTTPATLGLTEDIRSILSYALTEMMNNAIDHSNSEKATLSVVLTPTLLRFTIRDFGVGVFRNVKKKYRLDNEFQAMEELLKGKTTTAPLAHSGEGIFFTSKIADLFMLRSYAHELRIDNQLPDVFAGELGSELKGTEVTFQISPTSSKHLNDIFKMYTNSTDLSFDKTHAYIKLFTTGTIYISRSQAKRVLFGLDTRNFKEIILDFNQVPNIGQAFADEIFRVYANRHPDIKLTPINTNEAVDFMIGRTFGTSGTASK